MATHAFDGFMDRVSRERNIDPMLARAVINDFLRDLHECIYKDDGFGYALLYVMLECGGEAVYHLGGILTECAGDDAPDLRMSVNESIARLGYRLSRYRTVVDKWKMEKEWDEEDRLADLRAEQGNITPSSDSSRNA